MDVDEAIGIHLQEEIIMEILIRLRVRSLLRFKCVSRRWMKLISEPYFTKKHLEYNPNSQKNLICQWDGREKEYSLYCSSLSSVQRVEEVQKLDCPSNYKPSFCKLYCCCDSLVLIEVFDYHVRDYKQQIFLLWNPSTRESIVLPRPEFPPWPYCTWGLGYDSTSDDYKILKIDEKSRSEILRLKSGSWKVTDKHPTDIHPILTHTDSLVFVHGAFHWIGLFLAGKFLVISFSISDEMYGEIPLPEQMYYSGGSNKQGVSSLGEMLCAYYRHKSHTEYYFKIWVMKEYGVKESWTEVFNIQVTYLCSPVVPKYRFSDGDVLLCCIHLEPRSYVFRTSKGPFGLWLQSGATQIGLVYTESLIFPKLVG